MPNGAGKLPGLVPVSRTDYETFRRRADRVRVAGLDVELGAGGRVHALSPREFIPERTTVWSFPDRGDWATHAGNYRGNWSPFIPRNLILRYTKPGDTVLDPMLGSGTTLIECKVLGRHGIGVDVNFEALMVAWDRLGFSYRPLEEDWVNPRIDLFHGDARNLDLLRDDSVDLVATHPPYAGIIRYTGERVPGDLSALKLEDYLVEMRKVAAEA